MLERNFTIEQALGELAKGKRHRMAIIDHPDTGMVFFRAGSRFRIMELYVKYNDSYWDQTTFSGCIVLKQQSRYKEPWYMLTDKDWNLQASSFDDLQSEFTVVAFIEPSKQYVDSTDMPTNVAICLKAHFSAFGSAVALVQDMHITALWKAEVAALHSHILGTTITTKAELEREMDG